MSRRSSTSSFKTANTNLNDDGPRRDNADDYDWDHAQQNLDSEMSEEMGDYVTMNEGRRARALTEARTKYENQILGPYDEEHLCVRPEDLQTNHSRGVQLAVNKLNEGFEDTAPEDLKAELLRSLNSRYDYLKRLNEEHNREAVLAAKEEYRRVIQTHHTCVTVDMVTSYHDEARATAFDLFKSRRYPYVEYSEDSYRSQLDNFFRAELDELKRQNDTNNKNAINEALLVYDRAMRTHCPTDKCMHPDVLASKHRSVRPDAVTDFNNRRSTACATLNDEFKRKLNDELDEHYEDLKKNNHFKNEAAVMLHHEHFVSKTNEFGKMNFVFGFIPNVSKPTPRDFEKLKTEELDSFKSNRRNGQYYHSDEYREKLVKMLDRTSTQQIIFWYSD